MKKTIRHDFHFKKLLTTLFPEFIELFLPEMLLYLDLSSIASVDREILSAADIAEINQADIVMKARYKEREAFFIIHTEVQSQVQTDFPQRMFFYFAKLYEKYRLPVYPIVIFAFDSPQKEQECSLSIEFDDIEVMKFQYIKIQLNQLDWKDYVGVMNPVAAALMSKMRIHPSERSIVKLECLKLLGKLNLSKEINRVVSMFVDTYLWLTPEESEEYEMQKSKLEPELKDEIVEFETSWSIEGRKQGRIEGMVEMVASQLELRFGNVAKKYTEKVQKLDTKKLLRLGEALLGFQSIEDLDKWLVKHTQK